MGVGVAGMGKRSKTNPVFTGTEFEGNGEEEGARPVSLVNL